MLKIKYLGEPHLKHANRASNFGDIRAKGPSHSLDFVYLLFLLVCLSFVVRQIGHSEKAKGNW